MRSLPPPRITRNRRWKRIKRAISYFFRNGRFHDPTSYQYRNKSQSISKIKQLKLTSRIKRGKSDSVLKLSTNAGIKTVSFMGRVATKMSVPMFRKNLFNVSMKLS